MTQLALFCWCFLMFGALQPAYATSIVAKLEKGRIILAADTREDRLEASPLDSQHAFHDGGCKIVPLGPSGAAISGNLDYKRNVPSDPVPNWSAQSDAIAAYGEHQSSLRETAEDWAQRSASFFKKFGETAPQRVKALATANSEHVLVDAFFVGWEKQAPLLIWEKVYLDEGALSISTIGVREQILPIRELPYTTNATTQELIEGNSARMKNAAEDWEAKSSTIPKGEHVWRKLEFVIKATGRYDESVGQIVDVLEIPAGGQAAWLQNSTCPP
jgi:hypothetical protein